jgi:hypothetical protein
MDELEERLERAYGAKTYAELEPITRDLPETDSAETYAPRPVSANLPARIGGTPSRKRRSIAIMSGSVRRGAWVVPAKYNAFAFWGGVVLDLTNANFAQQEVVIRANAIMGGVEIIVPDDVTVHLEGTGFMGGYNETPADRQPPPGAPIVRVTGIAFWAGVQVKRKHVKPEDKASSPPNGM